MTQIPVVIMARGGSKGIRNKNLQLIHGRSLIERAVTVAMRSDFNCVYVYSDSDAIVEEARNAGAEIVSRPPEVSGDTTTSEQTMRAFIKSVDPHAKLEAIALQQCTTPFLASEDLNMAYSMFIAEKFDSIVTATPFVRFLGYKLASIPGTQDPSDFVPLTPYRERRQTTNPMYMENGGLYLATRDLWMSGRRIGVRCGIVPMDWWRSLEIDDSSDLEVARSIAHLFFKKELNGKEDTENIEGSCHSFQGS